MHSILLYLQIQSAKRGGKRIRRDWISGKSGEGVLPRPRDGIALPSRGSIITPLKQKYLQYNKKITDFFRQEISWQKKSPPLSVSSPLTVTIKHNPRFFKIIFVFPYKNLNIFRLKVFFLRKTESAHGQKLFFPYKDASVQFRNRIRKGSVL